jgi:hypothetical protein
VKKVFFIYIVLSSVFFIPNQALSGSYTLSFFNGAAGSSVRIRATDNYCVKSTSPHDFTLSYNEQRTVKINYKSGFFTSCGWRHSHQDFSIIQNWGSINRKAEVQWYKALAGGAYTHIKKDDDHIIHIKYGSTEVIEIN